MTLVATRPAPPAPPPPSRTNRALTAGSVALVSLIAFENLAVTTAMPAVAAALHGLPLYALAFAVPLATSLVAMVVAGRWSDSRGPIAPLWTGVGWFAAGLLMSGLAPSMWLMVAGRAVHGFGSGLVAVALYVVVGRAYPSADRPRIFAAFAAAWVVPSLVGPPVAGLVVDSAGWRWVFLSVPVLVVPAALAMRPGLRRLAPVAAAAPGAVRLFAAVAAAAGVLLLHLGGQFRDARGAALLLLGLVGTAVFGPRLLPPGTFRLARGLPTVIALRGLVGAAFVGAEVFVPLILTRERGLPPAAAGGALTVAALLWSLGSWVQGRPRAATFRITLLRAGLAFVAAGTATVAVLLVPWVPVAVGLAGWGVAGLGMGLAFPALSTLILDLSPVERQGVNSSAMQLADSLFSAAVLALGGTVFAALLASGGSVAYLSGPVISAALAAVAALAAGRVRV